MEFAVPISRFTPSNVRIGQPRVGPYRRTVPFGYNENQIHLNNLILSLHPLRVIELDMVRNQLILEEVKHTTATAHLSKLEQFQTLVGNSLEKHSKSWLEERQYPEGGCHPLQIWLKSHRLTLYLSSQPDMLPFFTEEGPAVLSEETVKPGDLIRAIVKIQGLSLQMSDDDVWTGKSRIQHHVLQLYKVTNDS
jgi:hypothetical protein